MKNSSVSVENIRFYACVNDDMQDVEYIREYAIEERQDFCINDDFFGMAVKFDVINDCFLFDKGVRRELTVSITDVDLDCKVAVCHQKAIFSKNMLTKSHFIAFPIEINDLPGIKTFKVEIFDEKAARLLAEREFHLFDIRSSRHPFDFYDVESAWLSPEFESSVFKSLHMSPDSLYSVNFGLLHRKTPDFPVVMPELELKLIYLDGPKVETIYTEPVCGHAENDEDVKCTVSFMFRAPEKLEGMIYAQLSCLEFPIAGIVFDPVMQNITGKVTGRALEPIGNYSAKECAKRLKMITRNEPDDDDIAEIFDFDGLLNKFIEDNNLDCEEDNEAPDMNPEVTQTVTSEETEGVTMKETPEDSTDGNLSLLSSLDHLTGLKSVKEKLTVYERVVRFNKLRADRGLPNPDVPLHAMFLGSPGTGKTTVAKLMGEMLHRAGLLSRGHVVVKERATLLGQNYNSESEKTLDAIEEARGGILLIDEAYQLYQPSDARDPGKFVIETLMTALADESNRDWMLVLAGYPDEIRHMAEMNPGFKSRIPDSNIYLFDDFSESELMEIAENYLSRMHYNLSDEARSALSARLRTDYMHKSKNFGNARHVLNLIQTEILPAMAVRVTETTDIMEDALTLIQASDIPKAVELPPLAKFRRIGFSA